MNKYEPLCEQSGKNSVKQQCLLFPGNFRVSDVLRCSDVTSYCFTFSFLCSNFYPLVSSAEQLALIVLQEEMAKHSGRCSV